MKIHNYNTDGIYTTTVKARLDPLATRKEGKKIFRMPARSTIVSLPKIGKDERAKFNLDDQKWVVEPVPKVIDYYHKETKELLQTIDSDFALDNGYTDKVPQTNYDVFDENADDWFIDYGLVLSDITYAKISVMAYEVGITMFSAQQLIEISNVATLNSNVQEIIEKSLSARDAVNLDDVENIEDVQIKFNEAYQALDNENGG